MTMMKVDITKGICPEFDSNVLDVCSDDQNEMKLVDLAITFRCTNSRICLF